MKIQKRQFVAKRFGHSTDVGFDWRRLAGHGRALPVAGTDIRLAVPIHWPDLAVDIDIQRCCLVTPSVDALPTSFSMGIASMIAGMNCLPLHASATIQ